MSDKDNPKRLPRFDRALLAIINHYGAARQAEKLVEEANELLEAIDSGNNERIEEEISDVQTVLDQFKLYYGVGKDRIKVVMLQKVERQHERMEAESRDARVQKIREKMRKGG